MHPDLSIINEAATGLLMMSESDYPFEILHWPGNIEDINQRLLQETNHDIETVIEKTTVEYLLRNMTRTNNGSDDEQHQTANRFTALQKLLNEKLKDIVVYRVGTIQVDVFIIGRLDDGSFGGLRTKLIET